MSDPVPEGPVPEIPVPESPVSQSPVPQSPGPVFDVVVAGGGMVGGLLAAALANTDVRVCVLEPSRPEPFEPGTDPAYDLRVSALSVASERMLDGVDAWSSIVARRACPFTDMMVWDGEEGGRTQFRAGDVGARSLGHIVENRVIQLALLEVLDAAENVTVLCPASLRGYVNEKDCIRVELEAAATNDTAGSRQAASQRHAGETARSEQDATMPAESGQNIIAPAGGDGTESITTRLLVGADGARSRVRESAGIAMPVSAYPQHALIASIHTCLPQQAITWQRFMPEGPQAFLPLCGARASMVWYHTAEEVKRLRALDDNAFAMAMENAFPTELGGVEAVSARGSFPISRAHARTYIAERVALVGDAAHVVHPLAGQGVNLGMMDAAVLAEVVLEAHHRGRDIGATAQLRQYERWRRGENALMIQVLDGFHRAFVPRPTVVRMTRSMAMNAANRATPIKLGMMKQAMGLAGRLPSLARR